MDIENLQIRQLDWSEILDVYMTRMQLDFPKAEIKPLEMIKNLCESGKNRTFGAYDDGKNLLAYAMFVRPTVGNVWLLDYFAVDGDLRGSGIGSAFLSALSQHIIDADAVLLEIERISSATTDAEMQKRERRKRFYLKNGICETGVYAWAEGVDYEILCMPVRCAVSGERAKEAMIDIYGTFFEKDRFIVY